MAAMHLSLADIGYERASNVCLQLSGLLNGR